MKKLLVIGNGTVGYDGKNCFVPNQTGAFLEKLNKSFNLSYTDFTCRYSKDSNLLDYNLIQHGINFEKIPNKYNLRLLFKLILLIQRTDFIYIFYPGNLGTIVSFIILLLRKPYGMYIRGQNYNRNCIDRVILRKSTFNCVVSPLFVDKLKQFDAHAILIKPMIAFDKNDIIKNRNYSNTLPVKLLFVGSVSQHKGIYELIEIAKLLYNNKLKFELNIVGGGKLFEEINDIIQCEQLSHIIKLHGLVSDKDQLQRFYTDSTAVIITSHNEGFPRVIYEAMLSGLPIFTTFVGGIPGRMINNYNCIEIPLNNPNNAASIILKAINDNQLLQSIGTEGCNTFNQLINSDLLNHHEAVIKNANS